MNNSLKFDEFNKAVVDGIKGFLPESFANADITLNMVNKNNGLVLTGLIVRNVDAVVTPTIYLNSFYEQYQNGAEFEDVLRRIAELRVNHEFTDEFDVEFVKEFDRCRDKIVPRLINANANVAMLTERPYTEVLDLAVTYHILLDADGTMSIPVTNSLIENWNVSVEELHKAAVSNISTVSPSTFKGMNEVMAEMTGMSAEEIGMPEEDKMYVLTNKNKSFGAAALLDKHMMHSITDRFGSVFVLPSSIHETLIVLMEENMDVSYLKNMVHEVNKTQVSVEDRLSENVYIYTASEGLLVA